MKSPTKSLPLPEAYFDRYSGGFWFQDAKGAWVRFQQNDFMRHLKAAGYSTTPAEGQIQSEADQTIVALQMTQNVDYAGPLAGYGQGFIEMEGKSILVTESPRLIRPLEGKYDVLGAMLLNMFGPEQLPYFEGWAKLAIESLSSGILRPGQAVVLAGPRGSGKTLLQKLITMILGGRGAHPHLFMTGGTSFNSELFGSEHLIIDDQYGKSDHHSRQRLTSQFKMITAAGSQQCHPKGKPAITLAPCWRLTASVNDNPQSLLVLPLFGEDLEDKIMLFKIEQRAMPMPTRTNQERDAFWNQLIADLPHWVHHLCEWTIPDEIAGDRYGIKHYHHPAILEAMESLSPESKFFDLLKAQFTGTFRPVRPWVGTAADLEILLTGVGAKSPYEARKLLYWNTACGTYLSSTAKKHPDHIRRSRRTDDSRLWEIDFPSEGPPVPNIDLGDHLRSLPPCPVVGTP